MERIRNLSTYQKVILLILISMLVLFGLVYIRATSLEGYEYKEEIFLPSYENGNTIYSGRLYDSDCSFTVTKEKVVSFRCEDKFYGPYTAIEDPTAIPKEYMDSPNAVGVELRNNGNLMFRGVVLTNEPSGLLLFKENGDLYGWSMIVTMSDGTQVDENGLAIDPWKPDVYTILELMEQPELTKKGEWPAFFLAAMVTAFTVISILFADELFRLGLIGRVRDWDQAEPSEFQIAGRYISWTLFPILILWIYLTGLR